MIISDVFRVYVVVDVDTDRLARLGLIMSPAAIHFFNFIYKDVRKFESIL